LARDVPRSGHGSRYRSSGAVRANRQFGVRSRRSAGGHSSGCHAGSQAAAALPTPPGATSEEVALGRRVYEGQIASAPCAGCHGTNAKGSPLGPDLTSGQWIWGDGSLAAIAHTIAVGVPRPKKYGAPMPPMGGAQLSPSELSAVAAYVWALGHRSGG